MARVISCGRREPEEDAAAGESGEFHRLAVRSRSGGGRVRVLRIMTRLLLRFRSTWRRPLSQEPPVSGGAADADVGSRRSIGRRSDGGVARAVPDEGCVGVLGVGGGAVSCAAPACGVGLPSDRRPRFRARGGRTLDDLCSDHHGSSRTSRSRPSPSRPSPSRSGTGSCASSIRSSPGSGAAARTGSSATGGAFPAPEDAPAPAADGADDPPPPVPPELAGVVEDLLRSVTGGFGATDRDGTVDGRSLLLVRWTLRGTCRSRRTR